MLLVNIDTGLEFETNEHVREVMTRVGTMKDFRRRQIVNKGGGDEKKILLSMHRNGLGDDFCSLPAIHAKIQQGYDVTVICRKSTMPMFERLGCKALDEALYPNAMKLFYNDFGTIYHLREWCTEHESETKGEVTKTRFQQMADYLSVDLPDSFSWSDTFNLKEERRKDYVYFCPRSQSFLRSYYHELHYPYIRVGIGGRMYTDVTQMVSGIYHAKCVVTTDTGLLHVALSLGTPVFAMFGATDENFIVGQYKKYIQGVVKVVRSNKEDVCKRPCNLQLSRGFELNNKCKDGYADCMKELTEELVNKEFSLFLELIH